MKSKLILIMTVSLFLGFQEIINANIANDFYGEIFLQDDSVEYTSDYLITDDTITINVSCGKADFDKLSTLADDFFYKSDALDILMKSYKLNTFHFSLITNDAVPEMGYSFNMGLPR